MNKAVLSPSKARQSSSERTLKLLHEKLDEAESEVKNLSDNLISYGFSSVAAPANNSERKNVIETIAPFEASENIVGYNDTMKKNYEDVVSRVCHVESTVQSLKLALVSLEAENTLMTRNSATKTLHANESYEKTLMKLKKDLTKTQKSLGESERFRAQTEEDFQKLRKILNCDAMTNSDIVLKIQEMYVTQDEVAKNADDLSRALNKEKNLRKNLEDSQSDLLNRVTEMEKIVERENHEMKMLSGDCMKLKRELLETSSRYDKEYQTRIKLETYVDKLRNDTEDMESKLLAISNDKQTLQLSLMMLKHENKELKQKEEFTQQSNNTLKDANLELEKRFKEMIETQRKLEDDNKILVAKHCDSVEQQKKAFAAKLQEQDKILDEAKESILQELRKEKQELLEKEKEIVILQKDRDTKQVLLDEKDKELSNIKEVLEKLTTDRENMIEENDKVLMEIKRDLDKFVSEKTCLSAELDDRKVENESLNHQNKKLSDQCEMLKVRVDTLEQQQTNHSRINIALQNMVEDKRRLAYENGVLSTENEKLQKKEKTVEKHLNELKNLLLTKDKEIESLMKQREKI
ncbi:coiled-coil domain-containing protein 150-like isoform X2 [Xenia sp. Carnegie-2017]|uniref:coiled-coil domain-containing protein 150-like isoform X2 n=1 Tax=Xenia sp. Carnegie-2017 TaxID=2897299 RepID=UPI001F04894B|nr:coiled-coil domain-containing protein 150-like isoform X2 [Xenia sp. Carnegie-2017]